MFFDRLAHGQFFKRLAEVKHLVAIRHLGFAQHRLRQGAEQRLGQFDQVFVVRVRHVQFHHGELWVMAYRDPFVAEVTVDFKHAFEAADHQTFQIQFRRDAQVHIEIQRVVMRDKRTGGSAAGDHLHHRGFHFHKAAGYHELTHGREDLRADAERMARLFVSDQIQIALAIADFLILQAVEFIRQRAQGFGQQAQLGAVDGEFASLRFEQLAAGGDDVAKVPFLKLFVVDAFRQVIAGHVQLDTAADVLEGDEGGFAHHAAGHYPAGHRNFNVQGSEFIVILRIEFSVQLVRGMIATEIVGESYALLTQRSQFFATSFQFIIKVNGLIGTLCLLFRHMGSS
ncbi:hypothetical protein SB01124_03621 [Klebsiella quasipneumoniae subsp. quasipneumoniae]|nr:hypothetical protein SB01124_03621 [Klebsiella quasipneumoniae subsp. quasipneumoniae]